jgi:hypothetical protein
MLGLLALLSAALFTGAAIYVSLVEHPARLELSPGALLRQWRPSYQRGAAMQGSLAMIGGVLGLIAWWLEADWHLLVGSLLLLANWPYTMFVIMPVNNKLKATTEGQADEETRALLRQWGRLHVARSLLGAVSTLMLLWAAAG